MLRNEKNVHFVSEIRFTKTLIDSNTVFVDSRTHVYSNKRVSLEGREKVPILIFKKFFFSVFVYSKFFTLRWYHFKISLSSVRIHSLRLFFLFYFGPSIGYELYSFLRIKSVDCDTKKKKKKKRRKFTYLDTLHMDIINNLSV